MSSKMTNQQSHIQRFYKDKIILLTGATGFLGKILVEKLLRSCPDIRCIYLLVREKNGLAVEDRLKHLVNDSVFFRLRKERPEFPEKLAVIQGDLHKPKLGLTQSDQAWLVQHVDIVLHSAATIKFNERLKLAIETNVTATKQLCCMAQDFINLKAFVYVSTAYSNCEKDLIPERVCPPPLCPDKLIRLADLLDEQVLDNITPSLIHPKPNTYIFTKCAAENIVLRYRTSLPIAILRPSIVVPASDEPAPGWIDNNQGTVGTVTSISAGIMHTIMCQSETQCNMVPVDKVANSIIALTFALASQNWQNNKDEDSLPIINFVAKSYNCMTWADFRYYLRRFVYENPSEHLVWYPFITTTQYHWTDKLFRLLLHHVPATVIDFVMGICGYPTRLRKIYRALDKYLAAMNYFSNHKFQFEERNADLLWGLLEPRDQELFPFNMADISWTSFTRKYVVGCRRYLLKEDDSNLEKARFRIKVLYGVHLITKGTCILMALKISFFILHLLGKHLTVI